MSERRDDDLVARLRALATADADRLPSPAVRVQVMQAWDARHEALATPRRRWLRVWLPVAATLTIVVGLMIGAMYDAPGSPRPVAARPAVTGQSEMEQFMVAVPDARVLPRFDHGEVIRVDIPSASGVIQADVLVGQDGVARAIRLVQE